MLSFYRSIIYKKLGFLIFLKNRSETHFGSGFAEGGRLGSDPIEIMIIHVKENLINLFEKWAGEKALCFFPLPPSGSSRKYYRIKSKNKTAIGAFYPNQKENIAFIEFSRHFFKKGLKVPEIYARDLKKKNYLVQDLGNETLFSLINKERKENDFSPQIIEIYKKAIKELIRFQTAGGEGLNYELCTPRGKFDRQSMLWDLNYFKYYFLKLAKIPFDEQKLEKGFRAFINYLLETDLNFFLYRDFQSRNIMILNNRPYFIDYQGGRKGAREYDLGSLLFDAKADLPQSIREELLKYYLNEAKKDEKFNEEKFLQYFYPYCLIRILQAMGSYGFRGFYEKKEHFLQSIPYALKNMDYLLKKMTLPKETKPLTDVLKIMVKSKALKVFEKKQTSFLTVSINSFSYKQGLPIDASGNGGGFIFDCRALTNPGRIEKYKELNGLDKSVISFFKKQKDIRIFLKNVEAIINQAMENYLERKFSHLMASFGCTGGQHRSVYCAEKIAKILEKKFPKAKICVKHLAQDENKL